MEHVERAGVHSGDSISVYPNYSLSEEVEKTLEDYTKRISKALNVVGLVNIQYAYDGKKIYVIEVNPRASQYSAYPEQGDESSYGKAGSCSYAGP